MFYIFPFLFDFWKNIWISLKNTTVQLDTLISICMEGSNFEEYVIIHVSHLGINMSHVYWSNVLNIISAYSSTNKHKVYMKIRGT